MQRLYHSLSLKTERNLPGGYQIQAPFSFGILHTAFHKLLKLHIVTNVYFCYHDSYQRAGVVVSHLQIGKKPSHCLPMCSLSLAICRPARLVAMQFPCW